MKIKLNGTMTLTIMSISIMTCSKTMKTLHSSSTTLSTTLSIMTQNVSRESQFYMPNVIMLSVVAPTEYKNDKTQHYGMKN
jgi:hypothetical protein